MTEDAARQQAIEAYDVLDGPPRSDLLSLVELAARCAGATTASVLLASPTGMRQVAAYGVDSRQSTMDDAACDAAVRHGRPSLLSDSGFHGSQPLTSPDGVVIGTLCVRHAQSRRFHEGTERALATIAARVVDVLELALARRRIAAADERVGDLLAQLSHDLRNPLASIRMSLELARDQLGDDAAAVDELLVRAERGAERMNVLIHDLLRDQGQARPPD